MAGPRAVVLTDDSNAGAQLRIYLAGTLRVRLGTELVIGPGYKRRRAKALLVYLYLKRGRPVSKYQILADLWPDVDAVDAGRVKHTVQLLRAALGGWLYIQEQDGAYSFNWEAPHWADIDEFELALQEAAHLEDLGRAHDALGQYRHAFALRRYGFLTEFRYDDWAAAEIARLQELFLEALEHASSLESALGAHQRAIDLLRQAVREDPLREGSYVQLMRELWLGGRRVDALRVYHNLRETLARTLDVQPQAQTMRLYEAIRRDEAVAV
jgi:DNA-binding SARP family transcriptional activator